MDMQHTGKLGVKECNKREQRCKNYLLQVDNSVICSDKAYFGQLARHNIKRYIDERLPEEYERCFVGLTAITKEAWNTAQNTEDQRERIHVLSLANECYSMKLDLLRNAAVVDDAIRFVSQKTIEKIKSDSDEDDKKESK